MDKCRDHCLVFKYDTKNTDKLPLLTSALMMFHLIFDALVNIDWISTMRKVDDKETKTLLERLDAEPELMAAFQSGIELVTSMLNSYLYSLTESKGSLGEKAFKSAQTLHGVLRLLKEISVFVETNGFRELDRTDYINYLLSQATDISTVLKLYEELTGSLVDDFSSKPLNK